MNEEDNTPDWADVNDWCYQNSRAIWDAAKYLSPSAQYRMHLAAWRWAGRPSITGETASD